MKSVGVPVVAALGVGILVDASEVMILLRRFWRFWRFNRRACSCQ